MSRLKDDVNILFLKVHHDGDWTTSLESFNRNDVNISSISYGLLSDNQDFEAILIKAKIKPYYKHLVDMLKTHPLIKKVDLRHSFNDRYHLLRIIAKSDISIVKKSYENNTIILKVKYSEGFEYWKFLGTRSELKQLIISISDVASIIKLRFIPATHYILNKEVSLSPRELQSLLSAYELGYFEYPRRCSLTDISQKLLISKATLNEYLRKAIRKVLLEKIDDLSFFVES
jgi:predicted DNA binding protein